MVSFAVQKILSLISLICFCLFFLRRQVQKNTIMIYIKECSAYVFF